VPVMYAAKSKLRLARLRLGIPLTQVAHDIHISVSLLSLVERGQVDRPELEKLMRRYLAGIAKATR